MKIKFKTNQAVIIVSEVQKIQAEDPETGTAAGKTKAIEVMPGKITKIEITDNGKGEDVAAYSVKSGSLEFNGLTEDQIFPNGAAVKKMLDDMLAPTDPGKTAPKKTGKAGGKAGADKE